MLNKIKEIAEKISPNLIEIRRHIHANPELSLHEQKTASYVAGVLSSCGISVKQNIGKTGVIGELKGNNTDQRILAIRTDMDALPIHEKTNLPYSSQKPGIMHACGHDIHTTIGLGTAMILSQIDEKLPGDIRFLFQPAEEIAKGANLMIKDGAMQNVNAIFGLHVFPSILSGNIGIKYGALTAAADDLEITIMGESGHGARPHEAIDAIWISAQVITNLQQAISRMQNPLRPVVLSIGKISGGKASNVIADEVKLLGTVRSLHPETYEKLPEWITQIVKSVCQTYGANCEVNYKRCVPSVQNDPHLTQIIEIAAKEALGNEKVEILTEPSLGAEDFSVYLTQCPGTMFRLGVGHKNRLNYPLHHPLFDPDEGAIMTGVITMTYAIYKYFTINILQ